MNCGCTTQGNPFERNEAILVPCVMHAVWLGVQVKALELQVDELNKEAKFQESLYRDAAAARDKHFASLKESNRLIEELKKFSLLFADGMSAFTAGKPVSDAPAQEKNHLAHPWISGWLYSRYIVLEEKATEKRKHEHKYSGRQCSECGEYKALEPIEGPGSVDE